MATRKKSAKKTVTAAAKGTLTTAAERAKLKRAGRARELLSLVERRMASITEDFYDIGQALKEMFEQKLYLALSHKTFAEMLAARGLLSDTQARKLIAVVTYFPRERAIEQGLEKAYALTRYADATSKPELPAALLESGVEIEGKPVGDASVREVARAARKLREKKPGRKISESERAASETIAALRTWLKGRGLARPQLVPVKQGAGFRVRLELSAEEIQRLLQRK